MSPPVTHPDVDYIVQEMHRMHAEMRGDLQIIRYEQMAQGKEIAGLKVKSGLWGGVAGSIPVALMAAWLYIKHAMQGETP